MASQQKKMAVIKTGGKQYIVTEGDTLKIEKIPVNEGEKVTFDQVLLTATEKAVVIGDPVVAKASVEAKVKTQGKAKKIFGVKMKAKKRYRRLFGHRQPYTEIEISKIKA